MTGCHEFCKGMTGCHEFCKGMTGYQELCKGLRWQVDLQLLSQCSSTYSVLASLSLRGTLRVVWDVKQLFVGWLLSVPATCQCVSGTDLLRQFYMLPH